MRYRAHIFLGREENVMGATLFSRTVHWSLSGLMHGSSSRVCFAAARRPWRADGDPRRAGGKMQVEVPSPALNSEKIHGIVHSPLILAGRCGYTNLLFCLPFPEWSLVGTSAPYQLRRMAQRLRVGAMCLAAVLCLPHANICNRVILNTAIQNI